MLSVVMVGLCCGGLSCHRDESGGESEHPAAQPAAEATSRAMVDLSTDERKQKVREDLVLIQRYDEGLTSVVEYARSRPELFPKDASLAKPRVTELTEAQREELLTTWRAFLDYTRALDAIKHYWHDCTKINPVTERDDRDAHVRAFTVAYLAWLVQYRHGLAFIDLTVPSKTLETLLDEGSTRHGISPRAFAALKWNIINVKAVSSLLGGHQYYAGLHRSVKRFAAEGAVERRAVDRIASSHREALADLKDRAAIEFSYNAFDIARDLGFKAWFPVQKGVAEWMGDTKVRRLHHNLVGPAQLAALHNAAAPGDILVVRHNWYLSNVGLPGFWPHAELYIGSAAELKAAVDGDPEVVAHYSETGPGGLTDYLAKTFPNKWAAYTRGEGMASKRLIEAVSEGVILSSIEEGAGADYVGVLRPRATKLEVALAIAKAFSLLGRPYDFNFDFLSDESLVCTELVYKAWHTEGISGGPRLETVTLMGRKTLPANDIVRQFDEEATSPQASMGFVLFIDGLERSDKAELSTKAAFRQTWKRPQWDVVQP